MGLRDKTTVLNTAVKHFQEFELPLDISQKAYMQILGSSAIHPISVKRSFKVWKYLVRGVEIRLSQIKPEPKPKPEPEPEPKKKLVTPKVPKPAPKKAEVKPAVKPAVKKGK